MLKTLIRNVEHKLESSLVHSISDDKTCAREFVVPKRVRNDVCYFSQRNAVSGLEDEQSTATVGGHIGYMAFKCAESGPIAKAVQCEEHACRGDGDHPPPGTEPPSETVPSGRGLVFDGWPGHFGLAEEGAGDPNIWLVATAAATACRGIAVTDAPGADERRGAPAPVRMVDRPACVSV